MDSVNRGLVEMSAYDGRASSANQEKRAASNLLIHLDEGNTTGRGEGEDEKADDKSNDNASQEVET